MYDFFEAQRVRLQRSDVSELAMTMLEWWHVSNDIGHVSARSPEGARRQSPENTAIKVFESRIKNV